MKTTAYKCDNCGKVEVEDEENQAERAHLTLTLGPRVLLSLDFCHGCAHRMKIAYDKKKVA